MHWHLIPNARATLSLIGALTLWPTAQGLAQRATRPAADSARVLRDNALALPDTSRDRTALLVAASQLLHGSSAVGIQQSVLLPLGETLLLRGQPDSAIGVLQRLMELALRTGSTTDDALVLMRLGVAERQLGQPEKALDYFLQGLLLIHVRVSLFGYNGDEGAARWLVGEKEAFLTIDSALFVSTNESRRLFPWSTERADSIARAMRYALPLQPNTGVAINDVGQLYSQLVNHIAALYRSAGKQDSAFVWFRSALPLTARLANWYTRLGFQYSELAFACSPIVHSQGCIDTREDELSFLFDRLRQQKWVGDIEGEANTLQQLSTAYSAIGRPDSSSLYASLYGSLRRALDTVELEQRDAPWKTTAARARMTAGQGLTAEALALYQVALQELDSISPLSPLYNPVTNATDEAEILTTMGSLELLLDNEHHVDSASAYFDSASTVYLNVLSSASSDENRVSIADRAAVLHQRWALSWLSEAAGADSSLRARRALGAFERGRAQTLRVRMHSRIPGESDPVLYDEGPSFHRINGEIDRFAIVPEIWIPADSIAVLSYMMTADTLVTWIYQSWDPAHRIHYAIQMVSRDDIRSLVGLVEEYLQAVAQYRTPSVTEAQYEDAVQRLSSVLVTLEDYALLEHAREVVIVPHGPLVALPFGVLATPHGKRRLGLAVALRYAPSLSLLNHLDDIDADTLGLPRSPESDAARKASQLLMSREEYLKRFGSASKRDSVSAARERWLGRAVVIANPVMPNVTAWGDKITLGSVDSLGSSTIARLLGTSLVPRTSATETAFMQLAPTATIIHLATHGLAYTDITRAGKSWIALSRSDQDDGFLTASEIFGDATFAITADLVVLSACQTAMGLQSEAEATVGLQRAFLGAGARSVLASMWPVDDGATSMLMVQFYRHWLLDSDEPSKAEALRRAEVYVSKRPRTAAPAFWAAFEITGAR